MSAGQQRAVLLPSPAPSAPRALDLADEVFDFDGAAAFLKVSESWLRRSDVPRAKVGGRVVFLRSQLLAYVAARLSHWVTP